LEAKNEAFEQCKGFRALVARLDAAEQLVMLGRDGVEALPLSCDR